MARLQEKYKTELIGEIQQKLGLKNPMQVPKITKITLNMGVGEAVADKKVMEHARADMKKIAGQNPVTRLARKSVAGFKIRDGYPIGCKVTLRRERMYEFLDRLVSIAIPRIRDFRGLNPKSFDRQGNYSMGVTEQIIFPEINYDEIDTFYQHTPVLEHLQNGATTALVLAGSYDYFIAFSNLVHIFIRGLGPAPTNSLRPRPLLQHLGRQRNDFHKAVRAQFACNRTKNTSTNRLKTRVQQNGGVAIETDQ